MPTVDELLGPPPTADDVLGPPPPTAAGNITDATAGVDMMSGPSMDAFFAQRTVGRLLNAAGEGFKQGWGSTDLGLSDETSAALKKAGVFADAEKGQGGVLRAFNEALMRPAALAADAVMRAGGAVVGAGQGVAAQLGAEVGLPGLGRDIAALPEAFPHEAMGAQGVLQRAARMPDVARVIGDSEAVWKGLEEPPAEEVTPPAAATEEPPPVSQELEVRPEPETPTPAPDVHQLARQIAPDTFQEFDTLQERSAGLRQEIAQQQDTLRQAAETQAPHAAEIADLRERLQDTTPRLAKKYEARLAEMLPDHDAFLADEFKMGALTRDTPEIAALRQEMQAADYRMRDLSPEVTDAYRQATEQMPPAPVPETAPVAPEPVVAPVVQAEPVTPPAVVPGPLPADVAETIPGMKPPEPALGPPEGRETPVPAPGQAPTEPVNIASDVAQKLVAAGRPAEEAEAASQLISAHYQARAARFEGAKGTAEDLYRAEAPEIRAGLQRAPRQLELAQSIRGKIKLDDGRAVITLMRDANASTFLHETGHAWLAEMLQDATDPKAPASLTNDAATVRSWVGAGEGEITRSQHEKFARGFERYMMEGRTPTQALASVFAKFRDWLTTLYQTVAKLRAPISDDIRDVFDRLLTTEPDRQPAIVPETAAEQLPVGGTMKPPAKQTPLYPKPPKEPTRLTSFIRKLGGMRDDGGEIANMLGGGKRPGLVNAAGLSPDEVALRAWEQGYFPELGDKRPSTNDLHNALEDDLQGHAARYSDNDQEAVAAYQDAIAHNEEVARLAANHDIDTTGLTREQFFEKLSEKLSMEQMYDLSESYADAHAEAFDEFAGDLRDWVEDNGGRWNSDEFYGNQGPRTLGDLETENRQENIARSAREGEAGNARPGSTDGSPGEGEESGGPGGRGAGATGRDGEEGAGGPRGSAAGGNAATGKPEPLPAIEVKGESRDFRKPEDAKIIKAANIRLDKINGTDAMDAALQQIASENGDFLNARYGEAAFRNQMDIRNTRILLRETVAEMMDSAKEAAAGDPAAIADFVTKSERSALVFGKLSSLTADWAHTGHELRKVMKGFDEARDIASQIEGTTGRTLYQLQQQAALLSKMDTAENAGLFAADMQRKSLWQHVRSWIISLFINNLISGPLTHAAYGVGNEVGALFKAGVITPVQATVGLVRGASEDRVYFSEAAAQLTAQFAGFRDGFPAAVKAWKAGVPIFPEGVQGELALRATATPRAQVIPGVVGTVIESPARAIAFVHTLSYTVGYTQEIARLSVRDALDRGLDLHSEDYNVSVAKFRSQPPAEAMMQAHGEAMKMVFMEKPTYGGNKAAIARLTQSLPAKIIMPFTQIGLNILERGIVDITPVSLARPEDRAALGGLNSGVRGAGAAFDIRAGKILAGSFAAGATVALALSGHMTGGGPSDPNKRRIWLEAGYKPYSARLWGNTWTPYRKYLGPLGPLVATSANFVEAGEAMNEHGMAGAAKALSLGFAEVIMDETWLSGLSNFIDAMHNADTKGNYYFRGLATSFIPFSAALNQVARQVDPYQRQAHTIIEAAINKVPFASRLLLPQISIWGQPIRSHTMLSPSAMMNDPVDNRLLALDHGLAMPEKKIRGVKLTDAQYNDYAISAGQLAKHMLDALVGAPGFASMPDGIQIKRIDETVSRAREAAAKLVMMRSFHSDNNIPLQALQNKAKLLQPTPH
ncbi:MAG: hypothetical protein ABI196_00650 [Bradyrhizobium sp.]